MSGPWPQRSRSTPTTLQGGNRIARIQGDAIGFAQSLSQAVEDGYQWTSQRGITIVKVALQSIEYDEDTRKLLSDVKKADALGGARGNSFMQQAAARGFEAAGSNPGGAGGGAGMAILGMGVNATGAAAGGLQQPVAPVQQVPAPASEAPAAPGSGEGAPAQAPAAAPAPGPAAGEDPVAKLTQLKTLLDQGLITQADFDAAKAKVLGL